MFITEYKPKKKFIRVTDKDREWTQTDGLAVYTRAALEISPDCPSRIVLVLEDAIRIGWIKQVAYVEEKTLMWETLKK